MKQHTPDSCLQPFVWFYSFIVAVLSPWSVAPSSGQGTEQLLVLDAPCMQLVDSAAPFNGCHYQISHFLCQEHVYF